jgi:hypothetical protein
MVFFFLSTFHFLTLLFDHDQRRIEVGARVRRVPGVTEGCLATDDSVGVLVVDAQDDQPYQVLFIYLF